MFNAFLRWLRRKKRKPLISREFWRLEHLPIFRVGRKRFYFEEVFIIGFAALGRPSVLESLPSDSIIRELHVVLEVTLLPGFPLNVDSPRRNFVKRQIGRQLISLS